MQNSPTGMPAPTADEPSVFDRLFLFRSAGRYFLVLMGFVAVTGTLESVPVWAFLKLGIPSVVWFYLTVALGVLAGSFGAEYPLLGGIAGGMCASGEFGSVLLLLSLEVSIPKFVIVLAALVGFAPGVIFYAVAERLVGKRNLANGANTSRLRKSGTRSELAGLADNSDQLPTQDDEPDRASPDLSRVVEASRARIDPLLKRDRFLVLKMLVGAVFAALFTFSVLYSDDKKRPAVRLAPATVAIAVTASLFIGASLAMLLSFRDAVELRQDSGRRIGWLARQYFGRGWVSLFIWIATILFLSLPLIVIVFGFLGL